MNKLSVIPAKTYIVIIPPQRIKAPISLLNQSSNGTLVTTASSAKYLGVIIDNELNFYEQIKVMDGKVARSVGILNKLKQTLPQTVMLLCISTSVTIVLSTNESGFGIAFPQILGHCRTKNSNIATKTFYYLRTNISIKDFVYTFFILLHDIIKQTSALIT